MTGPLPVPGGIGSAWGAASLLMLLVLAMLASLATLSLARTELHALRLDAGQQRHDRALAVAESAIQRLLARMPGLEDAGWNSSAEGPERRILSDTLDSLAVELELERTPLPARFLRVHASVRAGPAEHPLRVIRQTFRHLGILSPRGEQAPPLVLTGCLFDGAAMGDIYPLRADTDLAGDALWEAPGCPPPASDLHAGRAQPWNAQASLASALLSVDGDTLAQLALAQTQLPWGQRDYVLATSADLDASGRWWRDLGSPGHPVLLRVPETLGCPGFADGVRIHGLVLIEAPCPSGISAGNLDIHGTLAIEGDLVPASGGWTLAHPSLSEGGAQALRFPPLAHVPVPGSWSDF